jgi:hypothetical protein
MCSRTPIWCPTCGNTLLLLAGRRAECLSGHATGIDELPVPTGQRITSQYHGVGRSQVMSLTECQHCAPQ